jgi:hypothetical protein
MRRGQANNCVQAMPGFALLFMEAQVPGTPDAERWTLSNAA